MASSASASASNDAVATSSRGIKMKNAAGSRTDVGWKHGVEVDGSGRKIQCNYCKKTVTGGVYRFKHHLAGTQKDVGACSSVPDEVRKLMFGIVAGLQERLTKKSITLIETDDDDELGGKRKQSEEDGGGDKNIFKKRGVSTQATINSIFKKNLREEACEDIASFFYNNAIPFNVARTEEFSKMFESVSKHGPGFKLPSYHEIRVKYLKKKYDSTLQIIEEHKAHWNKFGCSIMTDGWTDKKRRTIINFLVNCPKGTVFLKSIDASDISKTADKIFKMIDDVVVEVGEENVIQVVTDNATNYKAAGEMLMEKRKKLYWTPCAAHCIDLMLEDLEKRIPVHHHTIPRGKKITTYIYSRTSLITLLHHFTEGKDLVRPVITRFASSYLTLGCLHDNKGALIRMFTSKEWKSSQFAKTKDGKLIEDVVLDKEFWKNIVTCLKGAYPLIRVLRMVDSDEKPAMGFIYEEIDRAKERIAHAFNGVARGYLPMWEVIDDRWDRQLHCPLHAAGYYLNPQLHYNSSFRADFEVKRGLYECLERMVGDIEEISKIDAQLEDFKYQRKFFGNPIAKIAIKKKTPAEWWESYGDEHPELQKFAIRVLSLTCSSSGCERNWSAFEMVHTKRRNRLKQKTMNDVVFVMANSRLAKKKVARKSNEYNVDDISSDDDWIAENDESPSNIEDLDVDNLMPTQNEALVEPSQPTNDLDLELPNYDEDGEEDAMPMLDDDCDLNALID